MQFSRYDYKMQNVGPWKKGRRRKIEWINGYGCKFKV